MAQQEHEILRPNGDSGANTLHDCFEAILAEYPMARASGSFGKDHKLWTTFDTIKRLLDSVEAIQARPTLKVRWSVGQGNWARVPWIAFLDSRDTDTVQRGVYCCYLFREDMSGFYVTFNQGVAKLKSDHGTAEARRILQQRAEDLRAHCPDLPTAGFALDNRIDLRASSGLGADYEHSTVAHKLYTPGAVPGDHEMLADLEAVLRAYDDYLNGERTPRQQPGEVPNEIREPTGIDKGSEAMPSLEVAVGNLIDYVTARGFVFHPWQIAAYVTSLRTKPFLILAGVSGTGKSMLPRLVAEGTGGQARLVPVRPDWTDSSEVLGYVDLRGRFRPGPLIELAREAERGSGSHFVCVVDEMNLARVEHYFAELLSCIEDRTPCETGGYQSGGLLNLSLREDDAGWAEQGLPPNLAIVGTVNMDESAHGFSRKVLDRAFTLEFSDIDLTVWNNGNPTEPKPSVWPVGTWYPRTDQLSHLTALSEEETAMVERVIKALTEVNGFLIQAQLQVGYRTRDEVTLFVLNAREVMQWFVTRDGKGVDPLDLALHMKVLPRIVGGSNAVRSVLLSLLGWAWDGRALDGEHEVEELIARWADGGRPSGLPDASFPRTAARLCLMWERLMNEGFTSFWL